MKATDNVWQYLLSSDDMIKLRKNFPGGLIMLDNLYENIGAKIKNAAKWIFVIETIVAVVSGLLLIPEDAGMMGYVLLICGPIIAWVSTWILYAFGELVEDVHLIRCKTVGETNKPVCANELDITAEPIVDIDEEEKLKIYIENALEEKQKPQELLDVYWQYKKYLYGYYSSTETKTELEKVIKKCEENDFEGNSQLMMKIAKRKISKL